MRKTSWKTGLVMATAMIAILIGLTACASESGNLEATLTAERAKLEQERTQAEACYSQVSGWNVSMEQFDVPVDCADAGDTGRVVFPMTTLAARLSDEIRRLELELESANSRTDSERNRADDAETRMREDAEKTSELREMLAQAERDVVDFQLESAQKIREGSDTIAEDAVDTIVTRSEISRESEAFWKTRFDDLEDKHEELLARMEALTNEQAQFDARVLEHVEANTKVERERLEEERQKAEERVAAAEERVTAAEEARERAILARLQAEKESTGTVATYKTKLEDLSKKEAEFNGKKAGNDAKCRSAWDRLDAEIENLLQQTSLLPPAQDDSEKTSRVAEIQYKMNVIRSLWSEYGGVCQVSK